MTYKVHIPPTPIPSPNSLWRHTNGNVYKVLHVANLDAEESRMREYPVTVVYQGPDGRIWAKPLEGFLASRTQA